MNAGCYGSYVADVLVEAVAVFRSGEVARFSADELGFGYRSSVLPEGAVIVEAVLEAPEGAL